MMTTTSSFTGAGSIAAALAAMTGAADGPTWFSDVTVRVGLEEYRATTGDGHGPGGVFADLDGDTYPDLYLMRRSRPNWLYRNVEDAGGRRFVRVPGEGGAGDPGKATGALAADYDNDGDLDLYVLNFDQPNALLQNQMAQTGTFGFVDVTAATDPTPGVPDDQHGVGIAYYDGVPLDNSLTAAWADVDRDGDLDLYVGNHNGYHQNNNEGPFTVPGRRDVFYLNLGDGTFLDATMAYGVTGYVSPSGTFQTPSQRFSSSNAVIFADFDNDRWPDLLVTNKVGGPTDYDMLYMNRGRTPSGTWLGFDMVTYDLTPTFGHRSDAAMGVDVGDLDNDGDLDICITDWSDPQNPQASGKNDLWINQWADTGHLSFVHSDAVPAKLSWGVQWQDFQLDGWQDLHIATDAVFHDYLYANQAGGFVDVSAEAGFTTQRNSRGSMTADYDRDGWVDLFVVHYDQGPSALYENDLADLVPEQRHHLSITLLGDPDAAGSTRSTRDAIGARVHLQADLDGDYTIEPDEHLIREVVSGSSNAASTSSLELEFGLRLATNAIVEVLWPSGRRSSFRVEADQFMLIDERTLRTGDVTGDGVVNVMDMLAVLLRWGPCPGCPEDITGDGVVDVLDLHELLLAWG